MFHSICFIFLLERAINKPTIFFLALVKKINFLSLILIEYRIPEEDDILFVNTTNNHLKHCLYNRNESTIHVNIILL